MYQAKDTINSLSYTTEIDTSFYANDKSNRQTKGSL
jgi:hypothetical protein